MPDVEQHGGAEPEEYPGLPYEEEYPGVPYEQEQDVTLKQDTVEQDIYMRHEQQRIEHEQQMMGQNMRGAALEMASRLSASSVEELLTNAKIVENYLSDGTLPEPKPTK